MLTPWRARRRAWSGAWLATWGWLLLVGVVACPELLLASPEGSPVLVGLDAEFGIENSTSADAIRAGMRVAIEEINTAGGLLGGRPLRLLEKDNRSVPARGVQNIKEFAQVEDLVAVFCGKFSPVVIEELPTIHQLKIPLLDPWAAGDPIIDNGYHPSYVFRLSLRDGWAMSAMIAHAMRRGADHFGLLLPNTAWGRSGQAAARLYAETHPDVHIVSERWYNWGDKSLTESYQKLLDAGAQAILLLANEREGSLLIRNVAALPASERVPILSHFGVTGGKLAQLAGEAMRQVDFSVVQTYSFIGDPSPLAHKVVATIGRILGVNGARAIPSPVGAAHAYDLTHILALAINRAGSTDRAAIRDALEHLGRYEGLVRLYDPPFTPERHEALRPELLFMARYDPDGAIVRITDPQPILPKP
ncbi:MAG: ABC transporter substrate-binding protein [Magnetococcales bacterium]|nr:ABC transporter substrate-binding protein [Magnetococcales bacterium]